MNSKKCAEIDTLWSLLYRIIIQNCVWSIKRQCTDPTKEGNSKKAYIFQTPDVSNGVVDVK